MGGLTGINKREKRLPNAGGRSPSRKLIRPKGTNIGMPSPTHLDRTALYNHSVKVVAGIVSVRAHSESDEAEPLQVTCVTSPSVVCTIKTRFSPLNGLLSAYDELRNAAELRNRINSLRLLREEYQFEGNQSLQKVLSLCLLSDFLSVGTTGDFYETCYSEILR